MQGSSITRLARRGFVIIWVGSRWSLFSWRIGWKKRLRIKISRGLTFFRDFAGGKLSRCGLRKLSDTAYKNAPPPSNNASSSSTPPSEPASSKSTQSTSKCKKASQSSPEIKALTLCKVLNTASKKPDDKLRVLLRSFQEDRDRACVNVLSKVWRTWSKF